MEQVILDHLYFDSRNTSKTDDHFYSNSRNRNRFDDHLHSEDVEHIGLGFREQNRLISLFGKYPNFVFVENGIKSNHSRYRLQFISDYYDEVKKELSTYVDNLPIGITAFYRDGENEPERAILYGKRGIMKKQIFYSDYNIVINTYDNYGNYIRSER